MKKYTIYNVRFTIKILLLFFLFYILHSTFYIPAALAADATPSAVFDAQIIGSSRLDPSSPLYFLKAVRENLEIKFAGTEKVRILRRLEFAERRLREVNSLITVKREDLVQPNMEKFLLEVNLVRPVEDKSLESTVSESLGHYMQVLIALHDNLTDPKARLGTRSAIYRLMDFNNTYYTNMDTGLAMKFFPIQAPRFALGCNLLAEESSDLSLNESERQVLKERGARCEEMITSVYKDIEEKLQKTSK